MSDPTPYRVRLKTFSVVKEATEPIDLRVIQTARAATDYLLPFFRQADAGREHFAILLLDARHHPIGARILFSGASCETPVYPKEIARQALLMNASGVICAHSHPSGDLTPSREDEAVTCRVAAALATIEVKLLDHLVLNDAGEYRSIPSR